jgi:isoleucyl-tRNA synthetase
MPDVRKDWLDEGLEKKWNDILKIKDMVSVGLEKARQDKTIGHSLDAAVTISLAQEKDIDEHVNKLLEPFETAKTVNGMETLLRGAAGALKEILIVSSFDFVDKPAESAYELRELPGFVIGIDKASGRKCERCWRYTTDVGSDESHPAVCKRCAQALK